MLNRLETEFVRAEQPAATQTRLENTSPAAPSRIRRAFRARQTQSPHRTQIPPQGRNRLGLRPGLRHDSRQAIARIKERLGIDLRWPTTYARFLQWRRQQRIQNGLAARLDKFRQFEKQCDLPASLAALEATAAALFLEQAVLQQDAALFLSLLRLRLRERTLALQEKKLALEQNRLQLEPASKPPPQPVPAPTPAEPSPIPAPMNSPQSTESLTPPSPICPSKSHQKHTAPAPNPNVKTQLYAETHNFLHLYSAAQEAGQTVLGKEANQPSTCEVESEVGETASLSARH